MTSTRLITLISVLALAGCAHQPPQPPKTQESFSTLIKPDGTKQFSYTLITEMPEGKFSGNKHGGPNGHGGHGGHGDGPRGDHKDKGHDDKDGAIQDRFERIFDDALNQKLNSTGFCRTDYHRLDTQSRRGAMLVKGECNETASDADREKFPNPAPKKVQVDVLE